MTSEAPDQWLIRTAENNISGPYSLQNIRDIVQQGKLALNDEVCHANAYWFYIHEVQEVRNQLGIEVPKALYRRKKGDGTQTDTTDIERTDPEIGATRMAPRSTVRPGGRDTESLPELSQSLDELGENTAVMSNRAFRDFRQKKKVDGAPAQVQTEMTESNNAPSLVGAPTGQGMPVERSKLVRFFTYLMMMGAVVLLIAVIKLLHQRPV